jgi:cell division protein FtsI (penicillin-binding protein 3)
MKLGRAAGPEALYGTMRAFGIGRATGVDLPGENAGLLRPIEQWRALTPAYMSFGQGLSTTTLQMAVAFATVANGGRTVRPYVVAATNGEPVSVPRGIRVLRRETVEKLRNALESVVVEGTATTAQVAGYRVAGKTGTAQKAIRGGYAKSQFVASFIGMVPVDDPQLVIAVVVDEPWPLYHGSQAAAPAFAEIASAALLYLGVTPSRELPEAWPGQQTVTAHFDDAAPVVPNLTRAAQATAAASISAPSPTPPGTVPDLVSLNKRDAVRTATGKGLALRLYGSGYVVRQVPAPGTPLDVAGPTLELWFGPAAPAVIAREGP